MIALYHSLDEWAMRVESRTPYGGPHLGREPKRGAGSDAAAPQAAAPDAAQQRGAS
jgi:hypothetical protein